MAHVKIESISIDPETLSDYDLSPFTAVTPLAIIVKIIMLPFFAINMIASFFTLHEDSPIYDLFEKGPLGVLIGIPLIVIAYGLGLVFIVVGIVTLPGSYIYIILSKEKFKF